MRRVYNVQGLPEILVSLKPLVWPGKSGFTYNVPLTLSHASHLVELLPILKKKNEDRYRLRVSNDSGGDRDGNRMRKKIERNKRFELEASYNSGTGDMEFE